MHALGLVLALAAAQEWSRFRGPNGAGVSPEAGLPASWTDAETRWKAALPGGGNSSPVAWGDRVFVTAADEAKGERYLLCLGLADGRERWRKTFPYSKYKIHKNSSHASSTPAADAARVYVLWHAPQSLEFHALDHDGNSVWKADLGRYQSGHGGSTSPIVHGDRVIVSNDHDGESFLAAYEAGTGKPAWKLPRIGDRACYSTPCVLERPGRPAEIVFTHSFRGITGVDAATGTQRWEIDVFGRHEQRAVGSPVLFGDLVIGSSGFTSGVRNVVAVRPGEGKAKEVYRLQDRVPHVPTPLVAGERLYLWSDSGIVTCAEAATGKIVWQDRVEGTFQGSPVAAGGKIYGMDLKGVVSVIAAGDQFRVLGRVDLGEPTRATPAVAGGLLLLRTWSRLVAVGGAR